MSIVELVNHTRAVHLLAVIWSSSLVQGDELHALGSSLHHKALEKMT